VRAADYIHVVWAADVISCERPPKSVSNADEMLAALLWLVPGCCFAVFFALPALFFEPPLLVSHCSLLSIPCKGVHLPPALASHAAVTHAFQLLASLFCPPACMMTGEALP